MALPEIKLTNYAPGLIKPRDYTISQNTIKTLVDRDEKANEAIGKLDAAKGRLMASVHESQRPNVEARYDAYLQSVKDKIDTKSGYAGNALSSAIRTGNSAANDYYFLGRVKSNNQYEEWKKQIQARTDIDQKTKDYFIKINPYYYYDQYEGEGKANLADLRTKERNELEEYNANPELYVLTKGSAPKVHNVTDKVVGGTDWEASRTPLSKLDMNELMTKVSQLVKPTTMSAETPLQYDPQTGYYFKQGSQTVSVSKERLKEAFIAAINATPNGRERLAQDLEVGLDDIISSGLGTRTESGTYIDSNGNPIDNEFTDSKGLALTADRYIESLIDPMAKALSYTSRASSRDYVAPAKGSNHGKGSGDNDDPYSAGEYTGLTVEKDFDSPATFRQIMQSSYNILHDLAAAQGVDTDKFDNPKDIINYLKSIDKLTPQMMAAYQAYEEAETTLNSNFDVGSIESIGIDDIYSSIMTGNAVTGSTEEIKKYDDLLNSFFNIPKSAFSYNSPDDYKSEKDYIATDNIYIPLVYGSKDFTEEVKQTFGEDFDYFFDIENGRIKINRNQRYVIPRLINAFDKIKIGNYSERNNIFSATNYKASVQNPLILQDLKRKGNYSVHSLPFVPYVSVQQDDRTIGSSYTLNHLRGSNKKTYIDMESLREGSFGSVINSIVGGIRWEHDFDSNVVKYRDFFSGIEEKRDNQNIKYNENGTKIKNQYDMNLRPYENLFSEYQLPYLDASDRNKLEAKLQQTIINSNPRNVTEYYVSDPNYQNINTNVDDPGIRIEIQRVLSNIYAKEPDRVKFDYEDISGDPVITVYPGSNSQLYQHAPTIGDTGGRIDNYSSGFSVIFPDAGDKAFKETFKSRYDILGAYLFNQDIGGQRSKHLMFNGTSITKDGGLYGNIPITERDALVLAGSKQSWKNLQNAIWSNKFITDTDILSAVIQIGEGMYGTLPKPNDEQLKGISVAVNKLSDRNDRVSKAIEEFAIATNEKNWLIILKTFNDIK